MRLYSYVVTHDHGFAPNPYQGMLTLATCKPRIRKRAQRSDWIMGTGSARGIGLNRLIFAGEVSRVVSMATYGSEDEFQCKTPARGRMLGDNIYYRDDRGGWIQRKNPFHSPCDMEHDLSGENVLLCETFWYFGADAPALPSAFHCLVKKGPNHKNNENHPNALDFIRWLHSFDVGVIGNPSSH